MPTKYNIKDFEEWRKNRQNKSQNNEIKTYAIVLMFKYAKPYLYACVQKYVGHKSKYCVSMEIQMLNPGQNVVSSELYTKK